ncbi:BolA family transcriptional regulator [Alkalilimnicola ehrlichii]|nr:BolA/IbaG family iron-sulfur metabolism protein [Alkalilimnicola ehrlichii]RFA30296.1 BolA family transcriptional regulator [Alkalilimnicola ehrlichii]
MDPQEIEVLIKAGLEAAEVEVQGDGRHFQATIVSPAFAGKTPIQRHRMVYALLEEHIHSDVLHAISMRTLTPDQRG